KHGLERHRGINSRTIYVIVPCALAPEEAWTRLALPTQGHYSLRLGSSAEVSGEVQWQTAPITFGGTAENLGDGLFSLIFEQQRATATFVLWGPARDQAGEVETAWTEALKTAMA